MCYQLEIHVLSLSDRIHLLEDLPVEDDVEQKRNLFDQLQGRLQFI